METSQEIANRGRRLTESYIKKNRLSKAEVARRFGISPQSLTHVMAKQDRQVTVNYLNSIFAFDLAKGTKYPFPIMEYITGEKEVSTEGAQVAALKGEIEALKGEIEALKDQVGKSINHTKALEKITLLLENQGAVTK